MAQIHNRSGAKWVRIPVIAYTEPIPTCCWCRERIVLQKVTGSPERLELGSTRYGRWCQENARRMGSRPEPSRPIKAESCFMWMVLHTYRVGRIVYGRSAPCNNQQRGNTPGRNSSDKAKDWPVNIRVISRVHRFSNQHRGITTTITAQRPTTFLCISREAHNSGATHYHPRFGSIHFGGSFSAHARSQSATDSDSLVSQSSTLSEPQAGVYAVAHITTDLAEPNQVFRPRLT